MNGRSRLIVRAALASLAIAFCVSVNTPAQAIECVPYARQVSGVAIMGDAWTWWGQARGAGYTTGGKPRSGSVMVFKRANGMRRGHVAVVREVVNAREVVIDHANWATRRSGRKGKIDRGVSVIDVSPRNDWSMVPRLVSADRRLRHQCLSALWFHLRRQGQSRHRDGGRRYGSAGRPPGGDRPAHRRRFPHCRYRPAVPRRGAGRDFGCPARRHRTYPRGQAGGHGPPDLFRRRSRPCRGRAGTTPDPNGRTSRAAPVPVPAAPISATRSAMWR